MDTIIDAVATLPHESAARCDPYSHRWTQARSYLDWATESLSGATTRDFASAMTFAKQAVCRRIDGLVLKNHLYPFASANYPSKMKVLRTLGIPTPGVVYRYVVEPRNLMEHDYSPPSKDAAITACEMADLFLLATEEEEQRQSIVGLNWHVQVCTSVVGGVANVGFRSFGPAPLFFADVFADPPSAKIVRESEGTVARCNFSVFTSAEAEALAVDLRRHYSEVVAGRRSIGAGFGYYLAIKEQSGL